MKKFYSRIEAHPAPSSLYEAGWKQRSRVNDSVSQTVTLGLI